MCLAIAPHDETADFVFSSEEAAAAAEEEEEEDEEAAAGAGALLMLMRGASMASDRSSRNSCVVDTVLHTRH